MRDRQCRRHPARLFPLLLAQAERHYRDIAPPSVVEIVQRDNPADDARHARNPLRSISAGPQRRQSAGSGREQNCSGAGAWDVLRLLIRESGTLLARYSSHSPAIVGVAWMQMILDRPRPSSGNYALCRAE